MKDAEVYQQELQADIQTERKLWVKECLVILCVTALIVIREVFLSEWFNFSVQ